MNLLRDVPWLRLWRRLADRRRMASPVYPVTVPAPLAGAAERRSPIVVTQVAPLSRVVNG